MMSRLVLAMAAVACLAIGSHAQLDPRIQYSTYLGGSKVTCTSNGQPCASPPVAIAEAVAVRTDGAGNIYVAGTTNEADFPTTTGAYKRTATMICTPDCVSGSSFLAKFSPSGALVFSTFLDDFFAVYSLAIDSVGNIYLVGDNNLGDANFRQYQAFIYKFSSSGARVYSYSPDNKSNCQQQDRAVAITLDASGKNAYVVGTSTPGFGCVNTTAGAYQSKGNGFGTGGIWATKLNVSASTSASMVYGTYIGPTNGMFVAGVAADSSGNAYLTGTVQNNLNPSQDGTFPTTAGASQTKPGGGTYDAYLTKLNASGTGLVYSTYLGGSGNETALGIRVDSVGNAYVTGGTLSGNSFPHNRTFGTDTSMAAFETRVNASGNGLLYSDLIFGANGRAVAIDSAGNAYGTGVTSSTHLPLVNPFQSTLRGTQNAFFTNLDATGNLTTSSYLGGNGSDQPNSIWVDKAWNAYLVGSTSSTNFPVTSNAYQNTLRGTQAVFLTKVILDADLSITSSPKPNPVAHGANLTYTYAVTNRGPDNSDGTTLTTSIPSGTTFVSFSTTAGSCSHPAVGGTGSFSCGRGSLLLAGHSWGPITLTVKVNAASGSTITNSAKVTAKTQDVNSANNIATVTVKVQ